MRKLSMSIIIVSLGILLIGCSNKHIAVDSKAENLGETTDYTEENIEAEDTEKHWLNYTEEEKVQMIQEKLDADGFTTYPIDEIVWEIDFLYQNTDYMMDQFDDAYYEAISSIEEMEITEVTDQYGNDYFAEEERVDLQHVIEDGNKVYVLYGSRDVSHLRVSVAEDGNWMTRDVSVSEIGINVEQALQQSGKNPADYDLFKGESYYYKNHIYTIVMKKDYRDVDDLVIDFQFNENGVTATLIAEGISLWPTFVETNTGELAILRELIGDNGHSSGTFEIAYLNDIENPILTFDTTNDFRNFLGQATNTVEHVFMSFDNGYLYAGDNKVYQLDTNTGEPVWDLDGQAKVIPFNLRESVIRFYNGSTFTVIDYETDTITEYDADFYPLSREIDLPFVLKGGTVYPEYIQTDSEEEIKIWQQKDFQGRSSLQMVTMRKGYDEIQ